MAVFKLERLFMEWQTATAKENNEYKIPERWLHLHYYEALNILFRFENSLRVFVYAVLKNKYYEQWKTQTFNTGDSQQKSIQNLAAKRISQAENFGYLGYDVKCPIMHLTSGELIELLTSDNYWPLFKSHFRGNKEIIKNKLLEIGSIRNSLAHFRPIKSDDVEIIKQNAKHTLIEIEKCLDNIFNQEQKVPTNSTFSWYKKISTLGNTFVTTNPLISKDEKWINLQLIFRSPMLEKNKYGDTYVAYKIAKLITPNIARDFTDLSSLVTYISESIRYPGINQDHDIHIRKIVNIVLSEQALRENSEAILMGIENIISKISEESELLIQDNLAKGTLLETASCSAHRLETGDRKYWKFEYNNLKRSYQPDDPDEYWGDFFSNEHDIVAGSTIYPWMSSEISKEEFPF
ncbi:hypothetical protein [Cellvibrio sp. UBA7671]|uniref:hypothetical protein n=1 Tax=Cellvibrio sp. UBA7671 TaxID=1946312 RepID=UPI002F35EFFA